MRFLFDAFNRWKTRRAFSRYISPALLDRRAYQPVTIVDLGTRREQRRVHFLLAQVRDDGAVATRLDQALALVAQHHPQDHLVFIEVMGSLLLVVFGQGQSLLGGRSLLEAQSGVTLSLDEGQKLLATLTEALLREIPGAIRVLAGETTAQVGIIGTGAAQHFYRALPDDFGELLKQVMAQPFGSGRRGAAVSDAESS